MARSPLTWSVAAAAAAMAASVGIVGADALWLVPLGRLVAHGHLPTSLPYATAPTHGWHDTAAGAQLLFWAAYRAFGGVRGIVVLQAAAAAIGFAALARGLRREATAGSALVASLVVLAGSIPTVVVAGASLFSLALLPVLVAVLESGTRLWLAVPLIAIWTNLHGGVLVGLALLACCVVVERRRKWPVLAAGVAAVFANPQLWRTPRYYEGIFHTVVARRGSGLWAPLGLKPFDIVLVVAAVALIACGIRHVRRWEAVALLGLAAETVHVARTGPWLLVLAAYPAARSLTLAAPRPRVVAVAAAAFAVLALTLLAKGPADPGSTALARAAADGRPVLADAVLGQQVVLAGGRVWVENPIDAFRQADQQLYVDWLAGKPSAAGAVAHAAWVLVQPGSEAGRRAAHDPRLVPVRVGKGAVLYRVRTAAMPFRS